MFYVTSVLVAAAISGAPAPDAEGAPAALRVAIPAHAWLYAAPDKKAKRFRIAKPSKKSAAPPVALSWEVGKTVGGFIELRPAQLHCQPVADKLQGLGLRLYAAESSLLQVLASPWKAEDGSLELGIGAQMVARKNGRFAIRTRRLHGIVAGAKPKLATRYRPAALPSSDTTGRIWIANTSLSVRAAKGEVTLAKGAWFFGGDDVDFSNPCVKLKGRRTKGKVGNMRMGLGRDNSAGARRSIPDGTALFWSGGGAAGTTTDVIEVPAKALKKRGERLCWAHKVSEFLPNATLTLCASEDDFEGGEDADDDDAGEDEDF